MLRFIKNFTDDLSRRFNTTALDIAPNQFLNDQVQLVSDIERPYIENIIVSFRVVSHLIPTNTGQSLTYILASSDNNSLLPDAIYNLKDLAKVTLESWFLTATVDRGVGGTGTYAVSVRNKTIGNNVAPSVAASSYLNDFSFPVGAGGASWHRQDNTNLVLYNGNRFLSAGNQPPGATPRAPQIIVPTIQIVVPNTAADLGITDFYLYFNYRIEYNKFPREFTDRTATFV